MDIEQLRLVLDALKELGHETGSVVALWLWLQFGASVLQITAVLLGILAVGVLITRTITAINRCDDTEEFMREMRDTLKTGSGGWLTREEMFRTISKLRELARDHAAWAGK